MTVAFKDRSCVSPQRPFVAPSAATLSFSLLHMFYRVTNLNSIRSSGGSSVAGERLDWEGSHKGKLYRSPAQSESAMS